MLNTFLNVLTILLFLILVNGVLALLIRSLPPNVFDETRPVYKIMAWEKRFYRRLGVHKWKNILPQAGSMTGFSRKRLPKVIDVAYTERFIWEICCAMLGHFTMAFAGLLAPLIINLPWVYDEGTNETTCNRTPWGTRRISPVFE